MALKGMTPMVILKGIVPEGDYPKGLGVNKRDSPRLFTVIHIDKEQQFAVSLKGSSLKGGAAGRRGREEADKFRGAPDLGPGYLKGAAQAECLSGL